MTLVELYQKAVKEYTKSQKEWKELFSMVARFYKQSFDNAVLIYAQKPNATQLATFTEWHDERIGRSVNKGAKGIAVIDMSNPKASFKYLFDFMDTNGNEESFQNVMNYRWSLEKEYQRQVLQRLGERYLVSTSSIETCLYQLCKKRVLEVMTPYMAEFEIRDQTSILYQFPKEAVKAEFLETLVDSVAYTVMKKYNVSTEQLEENTFETIEHFNTVGIFMTLGGYTVAIVRPILNEIQKEIQIIKEERSEGYENRAINGNRVSREKWSAVSEITDENREDTNREVRKTMEGIYDGELSSASRGTSSDRTDELDDRENERGRGELQGRTHSESIKEQSVAKHRRSIGESETYEYAYDDSRGTNDSSIPVKTEIEKEKQIESEPNIEERRQSPIEEKQSSMSDLLYQEEKRQETVIRKENTIDKR